MKLLSQVLLFSGLATVVVGYLWHYVAAFRTSAAWGLGTVFLPFVSLFFLFKHWDVARKPFIVRMSALVLLVFGVGLTPPGTYSSRSPADAGAVTGDAPEAARVHGGDAPTAHALPEAPEPPAWKRDYEWYAYSAGGRAQLHQEARAEGVCELTCTLDAAPQPDWRREGCVGTKNDFRFVSDSCEYALVLLERAALEGETWATSRVGTLYGRDGSARPVPAGRLVRDGSKLRVSSGRFFWLAGTAGIAGGARPVSVSGGLGGVSLTTADRQSHELRFEGAGGAEWVRPLDALEAHADAGWFRYTDAEGTEHVVESLGQVPRRYRARAQPVTASVSTLGGAEPASRGTFGDSQRKGEARTRELLDAARYPR